MVYRTADEKSLVHFCTKQEKELSVFHFKQGINGWTPVIDQWIFVIDKAGDLYKCKTSIDEIPGEPIRVLVDIFSNQLAYNNARLLPNYDKSSIFIHIRHQLGPFEG